MKQLMLAMIRFYQKPAPSKEGGWPFAVSAAVILFTGRTMTSTTLCREDPKDNM